MELPSVLPKALLKALKMAVPGLDAALSAGKAAMPTNARVYAETVLEGNRKTLTEKDLSKSERQVLQKAAGRAFQERQNNLDYRLERLHDGKTQPLKDWFQPRSDFKHLVADKKTGKLVEVGQPVEDPISSSVFDPLEAEHKRAKWLEKNARYYNEEALRPPSLDYAHYYDGGRLQSHVDDRNWAQAIVDSIFDPAFRMQTTIGSATLQRDAAGNVNLSDKYDFNTSGPGNQLRQMGALSAVKNRPTLLLDGLGYMLAPDKGKSRPVKINLRGADVFGNEKEPKRGKR